MTIQSELAARLLQSIADELEATWRTERSCNTMLARFAGNAALILRIDELTHRFWHLLKRSKWKDFYGGIITNARLPWFVPGRLRQLGPVEKVNSNHPVFADDYAIETFRRYNPEMLPCVDNGFDSILSAAQTELNIEEVALSQAILGRYDDAIETSQRLKDSYRESNVRFVIAIELYRHDQYGDGHASLKTIDPATLTDWSAAQFALGICNRVPWCPYPYPDY